MKMSMNSMLLAATLLVSGPSVMAQPPTDDALFQAFGGQPGLVKLVDDLIPRIMANPELQPFFKDTNLKNLKEQLVSQLCMVSGGPCKYAGADMKSVHADLGIRKGDFNLLVDVLQQTMDAQGIAFSEQNRLLARLAPMHRDIIAAPQ